MSLGVQEVSATKRSKVRHAHRDLLEADISPWISRKIPKREKERFQDNKQEQVAKPVSFGFCGSPT